MAFVLATAIIRKLAKLAGFTIWSAGMGVSCVKELTTVYNIVTITFYL